MKASTLMTIWIITLVLTFLRIVSHVGVEVQTYVVDWFDAWRAVVVLAVHLYLAFSVGRAVGSERK